MNEVSATTYGLRYSATILAGFISVLLMTAAISLVTYRSLSGLAESADNAARIRSTLDHLDNLRFLLDEAENRARDYLITGDQYNLDLYHAATDKVTQEARMVEALARDEDRQRQRFKNLAPLVSARLVTLGTAIELSA
jgi:CHASE3 domain sensor protein